MAEFSDEVLIGSVCRFCDRKFVNMYGNPYQHGHVAVCSDCWGLMPYNDKCGYQRAEVGISEEKDIWALRKSEILREIQYELEDDMKAFGLDKKITREERKESFEEWWLPKFKSWLADDIWWDQKKECYTLALEKDDGPVTMDFYPKGNKLLIRKENRWIQNGLNWLIKNVLPQEFKN